MNPTERKHIISIESYIFQNFMIYSYYYTKGCACMFSRFELKQAAKENLRGNWSFMAGLMVIIIILTFIASFVIGFIPILGPLLILFISTPLNFSQLIITVKLYKKEEIFVGDIFTGFSFILKIVGLTLWIALWTYLWMLLLIIPGVIKSYSYSMSYFCLLNNPELTVRQAMKESIRITKGYKADLFVLDLSWIGWSILSLFTCMIGYLFLSPYVIQTKYIAFRCLKENADGYVEEEASFAEEKLY